MKDMHVKMNRQPGNQRISRFSCLRVVFGMLGAAGLLLATDIATAQTTNAYDVAADAPYAGDGPPNGLSPGGQNGGFGFGAWTFTVNGNGGAFISGTGPSGDSFDLWNVNGNSSTIAVRPFSAPLSAGQSFSVQFRLNSLDGNSDTNALQFQDASGNALFSYYHVGGDNLNGHYMDGTTPNGTAVNFPYDYQQFDSFTFTLNNATTYTFKDNTSGASFSGLLSGAAIAQVAFVRANGNPTGNGQDFQFDTLMITSSGTGASPNFSQQNPTPGAYSVPITNGIGAQIVPGGASLNSNSVLLAIDGGNVTPTITSGVGGILNVNYQPPAPLSAGATHTVQLAVTDGNSHSFTNTWSFVTGFSSLPAALPGSFAVSNNSYVTIFSAAGDGWLGTNYGPGSSRTLYARFSTAFNSLNGGGLSYGGLEFYQDNTEQLLTGKNAGSDNWSVGAGAPNNDLPPVTAIVPNEWHTIVERIDYQAGGNANVTAWLDPDFTQTEASQPNGPLTFSMDNTFNNIVLRCGIGATSEQFSNILLAATSAGVGFAAPVDPQFQNFIPGINVSYAPPATPISVEVLFGSYGIGTNTVALTLDGNTVTPTFTVASNSIVVAYQPPAPLAAGSSHSVMLSLTDSNSTPYSTSWGFTVDAYPVLPVVQAGPFVTYTGPDTIIWVQQNEWIGNNYGPASTNTLYARFSMAFFDVDGETGNGGAFGGLEFYEGNTERLLIGNNWLSTNWSTGGAGAANGQLPNADIPPVTPIVLGEWHTMVVKSVYSVNANTDATIEVWLDPDFTRTEGNQTNAPLTLTMNNTFDNVRVRCGNGSANAEFTNIVMAATAPGVGFASAVSPGVLSLRNAAGGFQLSWTSTGTLQSAPAVTGPWTDFANQANPQVLPTTNSASFFRLRQ